MSRYRWLFSLQVDVDHTNVVWNPPPKHTNILHVLHAPVSGVGIGRTERPLPLLAPAQRSELALVIINMRIASRGGKTVDWAPIRHATPVESPTTIGLTGAPHVVQ